MIYLSSAAANEIKRLQSKRHLAQVPLRLGVQPGGCAAFLYTIDFDRVVQTSDRLIDCDGIQVLIDDDSANYVNGLTLDYSEDLMGGAFRFYNPNATQTCSCGNSFSV